MGSKDQGLTTLIKESIYIRVNNATLNRNIGKFNLSNTWDRVLLNTPGLKLNSNKGQVKYIKIDIHNLSPMGQYPNVTGHSGHGLNSVHVLRGS